MSSLKGFNNYTGPNFGTPQLNTLINVINQASKFYGGAIQKNIEYIKTMMDGSYGDANSKYNVVLEYMPKIDYGSANFYSEDGNFAYIGIGVNQINPYFTYLVYRFYVVPKSIWIYIDNGQARGIGLTQEQGNAIANVIIGVDGTQTCSCSRLPLILTRLQSVIFERWSIICQGTSDIHAFVQNVKNAWISLKPRACSYFIYAV